MKLLKTILILIAVVAIGGGAYYYYSQIYLPAQESAQTASSSSMSSITNDDELANAFSYIVEDYADAHLQLAVVLSADPSKVSYETWDKWAEENYAKWEKIKERADDALKYLDVEKVSFIPSAYAQSFNSNQIDLSPDSVDINLDQSNQVISPSPSGEAEEISLKDTKATTSFDKEVIKIADTTSKNQIKALMEKMGVEDPKVAMSVLQEARDHANQDWNDTEKMYANFSSGAEKIKIASFYSVAALGLVVSGGQLATATTTLGKIWAGTNLVFGGADVVLQTGEGVNYLIDNRKGQATFKEARENFNKINGIIEFVNLHEGLRSASNLITLENYAEKTADYMDQVNEDNKNATSQQKGAFMIENGEGNTEVTLSYDSNYQNPYENNPEKLMTDLEKLLPKDATVKIDDVFVTIGDEQDMKKLLAAKKQETQAAHGSFSGSYSYTEPISGLPYNGTLDFTIADDGTVTGDTKISINGNVTTHGVVTSVSGGAKASLAGTYDNSEIELKGNYTGSTTSVTQGHTAPYSDSGTVTFTGKTTDFNIFTGDAILSSADGKTYTATWTARAQ